MLEGSFPVEDFYRKKKMRKYEDHWRVPMKKETTEYGERLDINRMYSILDSFTRVSPALGYLDKVVDNFLNRVSRIRRKLMAMINN